MRSQLYNDDSHWLTDEEIKKYVILFMSDLCPVALTSNVMKADQRIVLNKMSVVLKYFTDPLQFACKRNICIDDAVL